MRFFTFLLAALLAGLPLSAFAEGGACTESEHQAKVREALAKTYGVKRHIEPQPPAVWALETMGAADRRCVVACRNNEPYDNFYLTYRGFEANGKPCEGETSVVMTHSEGLMKMLAKCMAGCSTTP